MQLRADAPAFVPSLEAAVAVTSTKKTLAQRRGASRTEKRAASAAAAAHYSCHPCTSSSSSSSSKASTFSVSAGRTRRDLQSTHPKGSDSERCRVRGHDRGIDTKDEPRTRSSRRRLPVRGRTRTSVDRQRWPPSSASVPSESALPSSPISPAMCHGVDGTVDEAYCLAQSQSCRSNRWRGRHDGQQGLPPKGSLRRSRAVAKDMSAHRRYLPVSSPRDASSGSWSSSLQTEECESVDGCDYPSLLREPADPSGPETPSSVVWRRLDKSKLISDTSSDGEMPTQPVGGEALDMNSSSTRLQLVPLISGHVRPSRAIPARDGALSSLSPCPMKEDDFPKLNDDEVLDDGSSVEAHVRSTRPALVSTRRRVDVTRLRDRWWDALQKLKQQEEEQRQQLLQEVGESSDEDGMNGSASGHSSTTPPLNRAATSTSAFIGRTASTVIAVPSAAVIVKDEQQGQPSDANDSDDSARVARRLLKAIRADDALELRRLLGVLRTNPNPGDVQDEFLRLQQDSRVFTSAPLPPLLLSARMGHDECVQALVAMSFGDRDGDSWHSIKDNCDNHVLHHWCRSNSPRAASTLQWLLHAIVDGKSGRVGPSRHRRPSPRLLKLMLAKNWRGQTPLHVACELGRADLVDVFLREVNATVVDKVWDVLDDLGQTPLLAGVASSSLDVVTSMLMWRGNNRNHRTPPRPSFPVANGGDASGAASCAKCPLEWAVLHLNTDMVQLILEFGSDCNVTSVLRSAMSDSPLGSDDQSSKCRVDSSTDDAARIRMIQILVNAGGNPCEAVSDSAKSALSIAARRGDARGLEALIDTYNSRLRRTREARRRDPVLQKQPESFFAGIESQENQERARAVRDALVTGLAMGFRSRHAKSITSMQCYECCQLLFRRGATLDDMSMVRLHAWISTGLPVGMDDNLESRSAECHYERRGLYSRPLEWSQMMIRMPWFGSACDCAGLRRVDPAHTAARNQVADVEIVSQVGTRYPAHSAVLLRCSDKFAALLRFESMATGDTTSRPRKLLEIRVDASPRVISWMLQHMYHGSVLMSESLVKADPVSIASDLLELLSVGEEILCPTLLQECELRFLSREPWHCYCVTCTASRTNNHSSSFYEAPCDGDGSRSRPRIRVQGPSFLLSGARAGLDPTIALQVLAVARQLQQSIGWDGHADADEDGATIDDDRNRDEVTLGGGYAINVSWTKSGICAGTSTPTRHRTDSVHAVEPLAALRSAAAASLLRDGVIFAHGSGGFGSDTCTESDDPCVPLTRGGGTDWMLSQEVVPSDDAYNDKDASLAWIMDLCLQEVASSRTMVPPAAAAAAMTSRYDRQRNRRGRAATLAVLAIPKETGLPIQ